MSITAPPTQPAAGAGLVLGKGRHHVGDRVFRGLAWGSGAAIMVILALVFVFLLIKGAPGLDYHGTEDVYGGKSSFLALVLPLLFGTAWAAVLALLFAVPVAIGIALFISHYAPKWLATPLGWLLDLLAAVPSVVFGLWGALVFGQWIKPFEGWLGDVFGWVPFFGGTPTVVGRSLLTAAIVLAVMILPIITSLTRDIFAQTPRLHEEAALALGATRWEMVRYAVFPYAKSGVVSSVMLGLGRALGETMAIAMVLSSSPIITWSIITDTNVRTIAAHIALNYKESTSASVSVLIACGLVLFLFTFVVNAAARGILARGEAKLR